MDSHIYDTINGFFKEFPLVRLQKGQAVLIDGMEKPDILWMRQGIIRMYQIAEDGSEITLTFFRAPDFFPMRLYLSHRQDEYYFQAINVVTARKAPAAKVEKFLKQNPEVLFELTKNFADAITGLLLRIEQLSAQNAYHRVASFMLYLVHTFGELNKDGNYEVSLHMGHRDIASWVGVARETVSHQMERLSESSIVVVQDKKLVVLDMERLKGIRNSTDR
jgi:CRP-like cAMP-binding protein